MNLIKILIIHFHYDLIMPNTGCVVQYFTKERILQKKEKYINMYMDIFCI